MITQAARVQVEWGDFALWWFIELKQKAKFKVGIMKKKVELRDIKIPGNTEWNQEHGLPNVLSSYLPQTWNLWVD